MKELLHDDDMREEGRAEERENTEREKARADAQEARANALEAKVRELEDKIRNMNLLSGYGIRGNSVFRSFSCFLLCLIPNAQFREKSFQHIATFLLQNSSGDGHLMVELRHFQNI